MSGCRNIAVLIQYQEKLQEQKGGKVWEEMVQKLGSGKGKKRKGGVRNFVPRRKCPQLN